MAKAAKKEKPTKLLPWQIEAKRHEERVNELRASLPQMDDAAALVDRYRLAIEAYHASALKNDEEGMRSAVQIMEALIANWWPSPPDDKYGGPRERFDCWSSVSDDLATRTAAPDGQVPLYGQRGRFVLEIAGCRADFHYDGVFGICGGSAHVIDLDRPFISETGYRSFQVCPYERTIWTGGLAVDEYLRRVCEAQLLQSGDKKLKEPKLVMVDRDKVGATPRHNWLHQQRQKDPAWQKGGFLARLPGVNHLAPMIREERSGQLALAF